MDELRKVVLARVDDRLIHGQVVVKWLRAVSCDELVVCDDGVRADAFLGQVLRLAAPPSVSLHVLSVSECAEYLGSCGRLEGARPRRVFLLVKTPRVALELVRRGVFIPRLIVGGMASGPGSHRLYRSISATPEQEAHLLEMQRLGVSVVFQTVPEPEESPVPLGALRSLSHAAVASKGR